ncbi:MAG: hypothetical protein AMS22_08390 [Thiotrichales bacterium SG8_50]|nr:MAG: hypothetical protein AMS22_08390 [Thiotrichales bacterium SG8_50]
MKERKRYSIAPIRLYPGDRLNCEITDEQGVKHRFTDDIDNDGLVVDTIITFDVEGELGLKAGFGAAFGKAAE